MAECSTLFSLCEILCGYASVQSRIHLKSKLLFNTEKYVENHILDEYKIDVSEP